MAITDQTIQLYYDRLIKVKEKEVAFSILEKKDRKMGCLIKGSFEFSDFLLKNHPVSTHKILRVKVSY